MFEVHTGQGTVTLLVRMKKTNVVEQIRQSVWDDGLTKSAEHSKAARTVLLDWLNEEIRRQNFSEARGTVGKVKLGFAKGLGKMHLSEIIFLHWKIDFKQIEYYSD